MEKFCESCGMPMKAVEDFGGKDENNKYCVYCTEEDGTLKAIEIKFEEMVQFVVARMNVERSVAEGITKETMSKQPAWQDRF